MADDANSEFERIFGKTQKSGDPNSPGSTKKLPSDSDLLGIRTDSDRFLVKNVPEQLPIDKDKASGGSPSANPGAESKAAQDAMTIALNVNVFANLGKSGRKPGESGADGPTFVIPLSKESIKTTAEIQKSGSAVPGTEGRRQTDAEFTRIMQIQDSVKVPKPKSFFEVFEKEQAEEPAAAVPEAKPAAAEPASVPPPATILPGVTATSGPSDFTKVVKGSELRALQDKLAASAAKAPPPIQQWQAAPQPNLPQYVPAPHAPLPGQVPSSHHRSPTAPPPSKLSQYMPLIIGLNVLVLLVILLIVFFALKK